MPMTNDPHSIANIKTFHTQGYHGYNLRFSPFNGNRIACATSKNYGIAGKGLLYVLDQSHPEAVSLLTTRSWHDCLFDVVWSEINDNIIVTAGGQGAIHIWDLSRPTMQAPPVALLEGHTADVFGIDWSQTRVEQLLVSGSLDKHVIVWDPIQGTLLSKWVAHSDVVYCTAWSPHLPGCFASASGDQTLKIWNIKGGQDPNVFMIPHVGEVLSCDWCKYNENVIATSTATGFILCWDIRNPVKPFSELQGHTRAVRRVKFSPHHDSVLASVSYDFMTLLWDWKNPPNPVKSLNHHKEFVYGLDFNIHIPNQLADCAWDQLVHIFNF